MDLIHFFAEEVQQDQNKIAQDKWIIGCKIIPPSQFLKALEIEQFVIFKSSLYLYIDSVREDDQPLHFELYNTIMNYCYI